MKYFAVFALLAVASAAVLPPSVVVNNPEIQEILASIQNPSTDPATAAALEQMLLEVLGIAKPEPIQVGPAIVDEYEPIHVGPAIVGEPIHVGPAIVDEYEPIHVGPAIVGEPIHVGPAIIDEYEPIHVGPAIVDEQEVTPVIPAPSAQSPLVQIILKINVPTNVPGSPIVVETVPPAPTPVQVVEEAAVAEPVIVVDKPVVPEPVIVAPVLPAPVVVLPDILN